MGLTKFEEKMLYLICAIISIVLIGFIIAMGIYVHSKSECDKRFGEQWVRDENLPRVCRNARGYIRYL